MGYRRKHKEIRNYFKLNENTYQNLQDESMAEPKENFTALNTYTLKKDKQQGRINEPKNQTFLFLKISVE